MLVLAFSVATLGSNIRRAREAARLSQPELAERIGISQAHISRIEKGLTPDPGISIVDAIARTLKITLDDLYRGKAKPPVADRPEPLATRVDQLATKFADSQEAFGLAETRFAQLVEILASEPALPARTRQRLRLVLPSRAS